MSKHLFEFCSDLWLKEVTVAPHKRRNVIAGAQSSVMYLPVAVTGIEKVHNLVVCGSI